MDPLFKEDINMAVGVWDGGSRHRNPVGCT